MKKFKILNQEKIPEKISFIKWDVEGTCTERDLLNPKVLNWIIKLALKGVVSVFVTGRDKYWLKRILISKIEENSRKNFKKVADSLFFRGELGLIEIDDPVSKDAEIASEIKNHPFLNPDVREKLANLFYRAEDLIPYRGKRKVPKGSEVGRDAARESFLFPKKPPKTVLFPDFIWSDYKIAMGTAEVRREGDSTISRRRAKKIVPVAKKIEKILEDWGYSDFLAVSSVDTAINFPLKLKGISLDKDWAIGRALIYFSKKFKLPVEEIANKTVAIGDGVADFLFSVPRIEGKDISISFIFVGPKSQYKPTPRQKENTIIKSIPPYFGVEVTLEVLEYFRDRFEGLKF